MKRTQKIVTKVSIPESLRLIQHGRSQSYTCVELGSYASVNCAVCRLNRQAGRQEFELETPDNGYTLLVTRN